MSFETNFRLISYLTVFCGFLSLWVSGTFGPVETGLFVTVMITAWLLEDSRWQISERIGTALIVLALPVYYILGRYQIFDLSISEAMLPGILARLILSLTAIKLLQRKSDRDWIFLYLMSFFEVLLAAGLSISIGYVLSFAAYIFAITCTIILFEIRKTERQTRTHTTSARRIDISDRQEMIPVRRVVAASAALILLVALVAVPTFFMLPRVGGAGLGGNQSGVSTMSGFSDTVSLGNFGRIQENDQVVMRVRIENETPASIHWRGVALDTFNGRSWSKTQPALKEPRMRNERDLIQVDLARRPEGMTLQTVYLEPLDAPVIFGLTRMVGVQGNFPVLYRDTHGAITFQQRTGERVSYKVLSDTENPSEAKLRSDRAAYPVEFANYLQLPQQLDPRIAALTSNLVSASRNRYDAARVVEAYLQNEFGYTLEQKAGGSDPLADFLFNVREGHCEYFATAMAVMLRTQGIATRIVNGFQRGEYNETAGVYVVRQRNAHSWVEVYFPATESWVTFDPTPIAGQNREASVAGFTHSFRKYLDALETYWIQYFVAFDNQEQRSLFTTMRRGFADYQDSISFGWNAMQAQAMEWWNQVRGDQGITASITAIGRGGLILAILIISMLLFVGLYRKVVKLKVWRVLRNRLFARQGASVVEFYERMQTILAGKGLVRSPHQTPLEFAYAVEIPEAVRITQEYNKVRFGEIELSDEEAGEIENWLKEISATETQRHRG
jgi:transglutaminase-like putative cysteine protease